MKSKDLLDAMTYIKDEYIVEAVRPRTGRALMIKRIAAIAACICIVAVSFMAMGGLFDPAQPETDVAQESGYVKIYYGEGEDDYELVHTDYDAEAIFTKWAELNSVTDLKLVECAYTDNGKIYHRNGIASKTVGDKVELKLVVSGDTADDALMESLRKTFYEYVPFDEFRTIVER